VLFDVKKAKNKKRLVITAVNTFHAAGQLLDELVHTGHCRNHTLFGSRLNAKDHKRFSADSTLYKLTEYQNMALWAPFSHDKRISHTDHSKHVQNTLSLIEYLTEHSESTLRLIMEHIENDGIMVLALLADEAEKARVHARMMLEQGTFTFHSTEILPTNRD